MDKECYLCNSKEKDEVKFGEFMTRGKISVHYFCLLLSSNLMQNGHDNEGLLGFLPKDIQEEANRVKPLICCYCQKPSANISCCASRCYKSFHLTCGDKHSTEHNFVGTFKSFCHRHVKGKKVTQPLPDEKCCICYDNMFGPGKRFDTVNMIRAPCCKNGWFHKYCLAAFAKTAGYFFKCPLCNDAKVFRQRLAYKSIFIPDRDAAWELEPNAFAELLERPNLCSAMNCCAEGGRNSENKRNEFLICSTCGSVAIHRLCMTVNVEHFYCDECMALTATIESSSVVNISASQQNKDDNGEGEDEEIDVGDDFDVSFLNNSGNQSAYEEEDANETINPLGLGKQRSVIANTMSDGDSNNCNFSGEDSDDNGEIIKPLGILKINNKYKIVDEDQSDNEVVLSLNSLKRNNSNVPNNFLDNQNASTSYKRQNRLISSETESLFDSGAESDRSGSSACKCNFSENSDLKVVVHVKKLNNLEIEKRVNRRSISLNDCAKENKIKAIPKRSLSECTETFVNSLENDSEFKTFEKVKNVFEGANEKKIDPKTGTEICNSETNSGPLLEIEVSCSKETNNSVTSEMVGALNSVTPKISPMRLRSRSEDISKRSQRFKRRISCVQSSCSRPMHQIGEIYSSKRPSKPLESSSVKRICLDSANDNERCKLTQKLDNNMTVSYDNEKMYAPNQTTEMEKHIPRARSPVFPNHNEVTTYITLPYIKKINAQKVDKTIATEDYIGAQPNLPEVGNVFSKNKPNIPQSKSLEHAKPEVIGKIREDIKINQNRPSTGTSCNIFEIFLATDKSKTQINKIKRIPTQKYPKGISIQPSNQPKIESFFKRI